MKYNEDVILEAVRKYIESTYSQHYVGEGGIQAIDVWASLGSAQTTVRDTALKYMMRFGRKEGFNEKDILKAIHYLVLLHYFTFKNNSAPKQEQYYPTEDMPTVNTAVAGVVIKGSGGVLMNEKPDWAADILDYASSVAHHDKVKASLAKTQPWVNIHDTLKKQHNVEINKDGDMI